MRRSLMEPTVRRGRVEGRLILDVSRAVRTHRSLPGSLDHRDDSVTGANRKRVHGGSGMRELFGIERGTGAIAVPPMLLRVVVAPRLTILPGSGRVDGSNPSVDRLCPMLDI